MKKILFIFILFLSVSAFCDNYNITNITEQIDNIKNNFSGFYSNEYDFKIYSLEFNEFMDKKNQWIYNDSEKNNEFKDLFTKEELQNNLGEFSETLLEIDENTKINLYKKFPNVNFNTNNPGYIIVMENSNSKNILFCNIKKEIKNNKFYPIDIFDTVIDKNLNKISILYLDYNFRIYCIVIDMNNKIGIKIKLPIKYSNNIRYRIIKSVRFWSSNIIKVNWDDSSVVYYKIFLSQEDFDKNIEKNLDKFSRIIYWNALGKEETEKNISWDYNSTEPKFNLDGFYYNKSKDNLANDTFF